MKKILVGLATLILGIGVWGTFATVATTDAWADKKAETAESKSGLDRTNQFLYETDGDSGDYGSEEAYKEKSGDALMGWVKIIINVVIGLVGLIAVVMIIIGGISFTTSQGDAGKVAKARNTILYGIVGLVVAILSFAIVNFAIVGSGTVQDTEGCVKSYGSGYVYDEEARDCVKK